MFETYQQQARTARDKKDKEDIIALRNEVQYMYIVYSSVVIQQCAYCTCTYDVMQRVLCVYTL